MKEYKPQRYPTPSGTEEMFSPQDAHLYLRDILNPLCKRFVQTIRSVPVGKEEPDFTSYLNGRIGRHEFTSVHASVHPFKTLAFGAAPRYQEYIRVGGRETPISPRWDAKLAYAMARTSAVLSNFITTDARSDLTHMINKLTGKHKNILTQATFHRTDIRGALQDAISSVHTSLMFFLESDVHTDPTELARESLNNGLFERLSLKAPLNLIGPMGVQGYYFPFPVLKRGPEGVLDFSPELVNVLQQEKEYFMKVLHMYRPDEIVFRRLVQAGRGCPVGRQSKDEASGQPYSGIRELSSVFVDYLEHYYHLPLSPEAKRWIQPRAKAR